MTNVEMVDILTDAFSAGEYSKMEVDQLHRLLENLSTDQFKDMTGKMLFVNTYRGKLPTLNAWRELYRDSKDEYIPRMPFSSTPGECNQCHNGFVYLYQQKNFRGGSGHVKVRCVARCTCAAAGRVGRVVPAIDHVQSQHTFDRLIDNVVDSKAYIWPDKKEQEPEKQKAPWDKETK